jgi:hypothetical protein
VKESDPVFNGIRGLACFNTQLIELSSGLNWREGCYAYAQQDSTPNPGVVSKALHRNHGG